MFQRKPQKRGLKGQRSEILQCRGNWRFKENLKKEDWKSFTNSIFLFAIVLVSKKTSKKRIERLAKYYRKSIHEIAVSKKTSKKRIESSLLLSYRTSYQYVSKKTSKKRIESSQLLNIHIYTHVVSKKTSKKRIESNF